MAEVKGNVQRDKFAIFVDNTTPSSTAINDYTATEAANMKAIALAQSYSVNQSIETEEVAELADLSADWANPEGTKKSYEISFEGLVFRQDAEGSYAYDDTQKTLGNESLKIGDVIFFALQDFDGNAVDGSLFKKYGKGMVTSIEETGSVGSIHTYSVTIQGKGELKSGAAPAA